MAVSFLLSSAVKIIINNKILYLNEYYILYCEFIDKVFQKITNEIDK